MIHPYFTNHARQRIAEMGLTENEVFHALRDPEMDYRAPRRHGETARLACRGKIAVAYKPDERHHGRMVVMTVLWNKQEFVRPEQERSNSS